MFVVALNLTVVLSSYVYLILFTRAFIFEQSFFILCVVSFIIIFIILLVI